MEEKKKKVEYVAPELTKKEKAKQTWDFYMMILSFLFISSFTIWMLLQQ